MNPAKDAHPKIDVALALFLWAIAIAFLWETRDLPPGYLDSMGPALVPQMIAGVIFTLGGVILFRAVQRMRAEVDEAEAADEAEALPSWLPRRGLALAMFLLTLSYVGVMQSRLLGFDAATIAFLLISGLLLKDRSRPRLVAVTAIALVMGIGGQYVFTQFFFVDLP